MRALAARAVLIAISARCLDSVADGAMTCAVGPLVMVVTKVSDSLGGAAAAAAEEVFAVAVAVVVAEADAGGEVENERGADTVFAATAAAVVGEEGRTSVGAAPLAEVLA